MTKTEKINKIKALMAENRRKRRGGLFASMFNNEVEARVLRQSLVQDNGMSHAEAFAIY